MTKKPIPTRAASAQHYFKFLGRPKLPSKAMVVLVPFFLSGIMSAVVSLISILRSVGLIEGMVALWLSS